MTLSRGAADHRRAPAFAPDQDGDWVDRQGAAVPCDRSGPARARAVVVVVLLLLGLQAGLVGYAAADEEDEPREANVLVLQTVALIANRAPTDVVVERLDDALSAPDPAGTDLARVQQARSLIEQAPARSEGGAALDQARQLLTEAIDIRFATGYGAIPEPREVGHDVSPYAAGAETGTTAVLDELQPARGVSDRGDAVLLGLAVLAVAAGLVLAHRWRPRASIRELRHSPVRS